MKNQSIFISYNPNSDFEQTLAVRMHTMGTINGFTMYLPDRYGYESSVDEETKIRIRQSDWFLVFSTGELSNVVKQEIEFAYRVLNNKSKIIVIYNFLKGKTLQGTITNHFTEVYFNPFTEDFDEVIHQKIIPYIIDVNYRELREQQLEAQNKELKQQRNALLALLGIGVGMVLLGSGSRNKQMSMV